MPTKALNAKVVEHVKAPKSGRKELWDRLLPGFGLRVTDKNARTWFIMYRADTTEGRKQRRLKIGDAKLMDLGEARDAAREALRKVARGIDPAEEKAPARAPAADDTVRALATDYLERYVKKNTRPSTYKETKRIFDVDVLPAWGKRAIAGITRRDVGELLDKIASRGAEIQANRTLARLKTFFNWAVDEEAIPVSPVVRMKPNRESARDRALDEDEILWFWQGCQKLGWPFGQLFQLLLLTAQRRDEVGTLTFPEIDLDKRLWSIPREKAKNDRAHEVHLSDLALTVLSSIGETRGKIDTLKDCPLVFTTNGVTPVSGFSRAKERLDAEMERLARKHRKLPEEDDALRRALKLKPGDELPRLVPEFILHDLRRTAATGMAKLNIAPHVVDKVLNHVSGTIRGVAAVYNRHAYTEERKTALEAWGRYVAALIEQKPSNVFALRG
jgi:integrase